METQTPDELRTILTDAINEWTGCAGHNRAARAKATATSVARKLRDAGEELGNDDWPDWKREELEAWLDGRDSRWATS